MPRPVPLCSTARWKVPSAKGETSWDPRRGKRGDLESRAAAAGGLPKDGHPGGISSEVADVVLDPVQSKGLVT